MPVPLSQAEIHEMVLSADIERRRKAAEELRSNFSILQNKELAWQDLIRLAQDKDSDVRQAAAGAIGSAFQYLKDKEQAEHELIRLAQDKDSDVRQAAAGAIGSAFQYLKDKEQAEHELIRLAQDKDSDVRQAAAGAIGSAFQYLKDKEQAEQYLIRLAQDKDSGVRSRANYALGRASILKATESEEMNDFRARLEEAIEYFERSSLEAKYYNPGAFCLPFYRSLRGLLFTDVSKEAEVQRYLAEAKQAASDSKSRAALLEAVDNLAQALREVRSYTLDDIISCRRDLKSYTRYCFKAAECLEEVRADAPFASKMVDAVMIEKSLPILDDKIKALFREVEDKTGKLCKNSKGTDLEELGRSIYESAKGLSDVKSLIAAERHLEDLVPLLKAHCSRLPESAQTYLRSLIESMDTAPLEQRFETLKLVLTAALVQGGNDDSRRKEREELKGLIQNLNNDILTLKMSSGLARKDLYELKIKIDDLKDRAKQSEALHREKVSLTQEDRAIIASLEKTREDLLQEIKKQATKEDVTKILEEIRKIERSGNRELLSLLSDISGLIGFALEIGMAFGAK